MTTIPFRPRLADSPSNPVRADANSMDISERLFSHLMVMWFLLLALLLRSLWG